MGGKARARRTRAAGRRLVHLRLPRQRDRRAATPPRDCSLVHGDAPSGGEGRDRGRRRRTRRPGIRSGRAPSLVRRHRRGPVGLLALLQLVRKATDLPLVAAGGIANGEAVAGVIAAGAAAAQIGSALMLTPEAGTSPPHRAAFNTDAPTALTRAFTGRRARGIVNRFMRDHDAAAPKAYPQVHYVTVPLRAAARAAGDADGINLWAGQAYPLAEAAPAATLVARWGAEAHAVLRR
jgi:nitronate monooxygenase